MNERGIFGKENEPITFKWLGLATPKHAVELGIPTEAPVLLSKYTDQEAECQCGVKYSPLTYSVGKETVSQHHHPGKDGGIYFRLLSQVLFEEGIGQGYGFIGILEPRGRVTDTASDSVIVKNLMVVCESTAPHQISEGLLLELPTGFFRPKCDDHVLDNERSSVSLTFQLNGGELRFSYP